MKTPVLESHFNKVAALKASNSIKKRLQTGFSCEYWETFEWLFHRISLLTAPVSSYYENSSSVR